MAKYLDKWKDLFPDTVGGTTRPSEAVSDQEEFNTDGFPQFIAQDPVNYALQNAFLKQFLSNDAWLWVKQKQANQALDDHKVDTQAHAKGISGNAGSATKLANARTIKLTGDVSGSATFNGTADASIDTTVSNATQATKLKTARSINLSGAVTADAASFDGTADATINVKTLDASKLKGTTSVSTTGNAATASKLASPRTISLTGKAAGSTSFDGSANASINVKSVNADTASKLSTARKINITGNATGAAAFDGSGDININTTVNESKHAAAATTVNATAPNGGAADLAFGTMAANDYARIRVYGKDDNGALEIATADGGNEPIYARQYSGAYDWPNGRPGTVTNEAAILDSNGNTKFPKNVTAASFTGPLNGNAATASKLNTVGGGTTTFNWVGKAGQPNWLWGGNNSAPTEQYVYNPSNFHVAAANTATSATTAGNVSNKIYYSADSPSVATDKLFTVKQAYAGEDNVPNNGLVIQSGPTGANYNGKLYITDNGSDGVWIGGVAAGKEVGWTRLVENKGTWNISISGNAASATNADKLDGYHVSDLLGKIYPVGSIYMSMSATNPHDLFGVGTWKRISQGRMLLGADDSTYKAGATGGEATHTLTAAEMPAHSHGISTSGDHSHYFYGSDNNNGPLTEGDGLDTEGNDHFTRNVRFTTSSAGAHTHTISNSGGGAAHNNMPPYLVCYIWQRTA